MNQTNNRIREEIEEEFKEILEYGKNLKGEEVWTDSEKMHWLRKKIDELLKSQREEMIEKIEKLIVNRPEKVAELNKDLDSRTQQDSYSTAIGFCGAIDEVVNIIKEQ